MPSVLDGSSQILLANIMTPKRLICTYASDMACPVPSHNYVLVNRSMLCNCHMESGLTYLLKSNAFCETASADYTMSFTLNLAFLHMIQDLWPDNFTLLSPNITMKELSFPLSLSSNAEFRQRNTNVSYPLTGSLPLTAPIIPSEGHAKYVCLDPWINAPITMVSLGTVIAYLMVRCRHHTLCRGLEYTTACHVYVFISRNERYSPIKLHSTTELLYNFVTNKKLPIEALTLHQGCPWDTLHINWRDVKLTNGETSIKLPYNVKVPLKEKSRLCNLMKGPDCTAHLMILQGHTGSINP